MRTISIQKARHSLDQLFREVNGDVDYIVIKYKIGNCVLLSEKNWLSLTNDHDDQNSDSICTHLP